MSNTRFSKASVKAQMEERLNSIQSRFNFDPNNGYAQVRGLPDFIQRAYGEFRGLLELCNRLGIRPTVNYKPGPGDHVAHRFQRGLIRE